jgi:hypothetical protein
LGSVFEQSLAPSREVYLSPQARLEISYPLPNVAQVVN